ncbi:QsdR family transcriptional regulator [Nocardia huaxiensis]|uniref:TetR family transcriptional regulator n=1 Tax=Nocardia huaxiensis TaxID=2755382 RepID=A0A7D6ZGF7_9NOCA|nr:QsdR family transcriptional regulator [Nocardia huaxiensis]QLY33198.1 TetR family transcriptional regulator [Nocardia huaxiensis]UFS99873.1 TetR family transcriptional regulator [Nocardia huaxiensis]
MTRSEGTRAPGRPASASREDVLRAAIAVFLAGKRLDVNAIAAQLGVGRASIYRWFGSRDGLLGAAIAHQLERMIAHIESRCTATGGARLEHILDRTVHLLVEDDSLRTYFDNESTAALRLVTRSDGPVHQAAVHHVEQLIARAETEGYHPPIDRDTLAYALVRLWEAFLYNDAVAGFRGDGERLRQVQSALLRA